MSDIFIQGETLQIGKKVDYVEIQGVNETVESLSPKIVAGGGGDNKDWLLDPSWLDSLYKGLNYNDGEYGGYDFSGCKYNSQYEYNNYLVTRNGEIMIDHGHSANVNFAFCKTIDYTKVKRIDIDIEVYTNVHRQYNMTDVYLATSPNVSSPYSGGISGGVVKFIRYLNNYTYTPEQINNQTYITLHSESQYKLERQIVSIDLAGLVKDGIVDSNVYLLFHRCDCGFYLRSIELVH